MFAILGDLQWTGYSKVCCSRLKGLNTNKASLKVQVPDELVSNWRNNRT